MTYDKTNAEQEVGKLIIECDCGSHLLIVEYDDDPLMTFNFAMYQYGRSGTTWRYRLRHIWNIITKGDVYTDQIILNPNEGRKLADFINKFFQP